MTETSVKKMKFHWAFMISCRDFFFLSFEQNSYTKKKKKEEEREIKRALMTVRINNSNCFLSLSPKWYWPDNHPNLE